MQRSSKIFQSLMALVMVVGLLAPTALVSSPVRNANISPAFAALISEAPDQLVRVIIQKADQSNLAERLVQKLGGNILKDLAIINAFAAEIPANSIGDLAGSEAVSMVSLDAPVMSSGKPVTTETFYLYDTFDTGTFNNNNGYASFTTDWIEEDIAGPGPEAGNVYVSVELDTKCDPNSCVPVSTGGELRLADYPDTGTQPSAAREADLSNGVTSATLAYIFAAGPGVDQDEDIVVLEISSDGGVTYTPLTIYNLRGPIIGSHTLDILEYVSAQTRIRFRVQSGYNGPDEYFAIDNLRITYEGSALPNSTYLDTLGVRPVWDMGYTGEGIGVAVIDSGISNDRDLNVIAKVSFNPNSNTVNDVHGHGTHVAGIIGMNGTDSADRYLGIAPDADLISLKISDENGMAYESDTVDALQWVRDHQAQYNIRVVNLSIQSTVEQSYNDSALNAAAEILWLDGIVVVAASGNWDGENFNPIYAAPANDPFLITVGATNEKGTTRVRDDALATFSAEGETQDFFLKPEIYAPGKDIISVLSKDSTWYVEHPERAIFGSQYFRISGTSMAAPMVSGAVALLLQAEPNLTPDQVKYRLIQTGGEVSNNPYLDVYAALTTPTTESANQGVVPHQILAKMAMLAYWASQNGEENIDWGSINWDSVNWDSVNWDSVNWDSVNWNAVNWNAVNWNAVNWNAVNWNAVNWNAVNWNAVNWNAVNWNAVNWNAVNWNSTYWGE